MRNTLSTSDLHTYKKREKLTVKGTEKKVKSRELFAKNRPWNRMDRHCSLWGIG